MQQYELLCVLPGTIAEDEVPALVEQVKTVLTEQGATDVSVEDKGKSRLAYPMKHIRYGYFHFFTFRSEPQVIPAVQDKLRLMRELLRSLVTKVDPEKREQKQAAMARMTRQSEQTQRDAAPTAQTAPTKEATPAPAEKKETAPPEPAKEVSMEEIDKKLDEIIDASVV